jgi:tripartite-type tricarboxylate transporter receptor subunit TctC
MDRTFIASTAGAPYIIIVSTSSPYMSLKDLEDEAKKDPGNFTWTSMGGAGGHDFTFRQFFKASGVDVYKTRAVMSVSGSTAVTLTASSSVKMGAGTPASCGPALRGVMVRALAITSEKRLSDFPDLPTTEELGRPTLNAIAWVGISGPPKLPSHIVRIWNEAIKMMLNDPDILSKMKNFGLTPLYLDADATRERVIKQIGEAEILWGLK